MFQAWSVGLTHVRLEGTTESWHFSCEQAVCTPWEGQGHGGAHLLAVDTGSSALFGSSPLGSGGWNSQPFVSFSLQHSP